MVVSHGRDTTHEQHTTHALHAAAAAHRRTCSTCTSNYERMRWMDGIVWTRTDRCTAIHTHTARITQQHTAARASRAEQLRMRWMDCIILTHTDRCTAMHTHTARSTQQHTAASAPRAAHSTQQKMQRNNCGWDGMDRQRRLPRRRRRRRRRRDVHALCEPMHAA